MKSYILNGFLMLFLFSSWGIYRNYKRPDNLETGLYGDMNLSPDSANLALLPWQEMFTDNKLAQLIEYGLENNTDIRIAGLRIEQSEASLKAARLAFLPSLALSPQGGINQIGANSVNYTYSLPAAASWQIDVFGRLRNAKERSRMMVESSFAYRKAVRVGLISTIAAQYYTLAMLREQAEIVNNSVTLWAETVRTMRLFMEAGQYNDAAVSQAEANYNNVMASELNIKQQIREMENSLSVILGDTIHNIETSSLSTWKKTSLTEVGIPVQLLSMRPDVMQAEAMLAVAFYAANEARSQFYPDLSLGGRAGWANFAFDVTNPGQVMWETLASLTQPVFQNGRIRAHFTKTASQQEEDKIKFRQTLLNEGMESKNT